LLGFVPSTLRWGLGRYWWMPHWWTWCCCDQWSDDPPIEYLVGWNLLQSIWWMICCVVCSLFKHISYCPWRWWQGMLVRTSGCRAYVVLLGLVQGTTWRDPVISDGVGPPFCRVDYTCHL
jgi:hypothetical protein